MGGWTILALDGDRATGLSAIEHALALNPNCALAWSFFGWAQGFHFHNRSASAIEALERAMRLSPLDPLRWVFYGGLAHAHFAANHHEEAIEWADRALHAQPRMPAVAQSRRPPVPISGALKTHAFASDAFASCVPERLLTASKKRSADPSRLNSSLFELTACARLACRRSNPPVTRSAWSGAGAVFRAAWPGFPQRFPSEGHRKSRPRALRARSAANPHRARKIRSLRPVRSTMHRHRARGVVLPLAGPKCCGPRRLGYGSSARPARETDRRRRA